jgi:HSP20 family protein
MATFPELFRSNTNPFRELSRVQREMDRIFDGFYERPFKTGDVSLASSNWAPPCEIHETATAYELRAEMPGIRKEDIKIDIEENRVSFAAEKRSQRNGEAAKDAKTHFSEFSYGSFSRSFSLPQSIDLEKSGAAFDHGVLTITLTKAAPPAAKTRTLTVK